MLSNEKSEIGEVTLLLQYLAAKLCLCHFTVKMFRHGAIKRPENRG